MYSLCVQEGSLNTSELTGTAKCQDTINYMEFGFKVIAKYALNLKQVIFGIWLLRNIYFSYHLPVFLPE